MTTIHDSTSLVIPRLVRKFNPQILYNRIYLSQKDSQGNLFNVGGGLVNGIGGTNIGPPWVDYYEEVDSNWGEDEIGNHLSSLQGNFGYARYQWEIQIVGMVVRLLQWINLEPLFADLGIVETSDTTFRVSDIQYDISETGPITTAVLEDPAVDLIPEKIARSSGRGSLSTALESVIDAKITKFYQSLNSTKWIRITTFTNTDRLDGTANIPMMTDETARILPGYALKVTTDAGDTLYGIIQSITSSNIVKAGPAISDDIVDLQYATQENCLELTLFLQGKFAATASTTLLKDIEKKFYSWSFQTAYLVMAGVNAEIEDTGANQPHVNISIAGNKVVTDNTTNGLEINQATWVYTTYGISSEYYKIENGDVIEITTDAAGSNDDAEHLSIVLKFVLE